MAVGRAVITTDVPGCRETVADKVNGFLIEPWNPRILAEKMIYFIENREAVRLMGNASYAIAKDKFDAEKVDLKLLDILKRVTRLPAFEFRSFLINPRHSRESGNPGSLSFGHFR